MRSHARDLVLVALLLASGSALADPPLEPSPTGDETRAAADRDFEEGKALMDAGQTAAACDKFAHSQQLDPKLGRLLNLAYCHEQEGKTASAWREYNAAAKLAEEKGQKDRLDFARERAAAIGKRLALVHLVLPLGVEGVTIDGAALAHDQWSAPLPIDPGEHVVVASATARRPRSTTFQVAPHAGVQDVVVAELEPDRVASPAPAVAPIASPAPAAPASEPATSPAEPEPETPHASRVPAFVALGVAIAGAGVGTAFGVMAASKKSDADAHCPDKLCDAAGSASIGDARSDATVSTIGFAVAIVGAGAATWLFLAPPGGSGASARVSPVLTARSAGLGVEGTW